MNKIEAYPTLEDLTASKFALTNKEYSILVYRIRGETKVQIASKYGVSATRIGQIEKKALRKIGLTGEVASPVVEPAPVAPNYVGTLEPPVPAPKPETRLTYKEISDFTHYIDSSVVVGKHLDASARSVIRAASRVGTNGKPGSVAFEVSGFATDEEALALRDMLWYASSYGVEVIFNPSHRK